ncbi:hypothetical protein PR048_020365 [Dryococelus australis]|uniref:DDE-1 domain-containing protein n=1 Tax=Dryococelus australis TaxID=614101 RepID=A0ABQ9H659_9NEOP|nr:hypothetical protein PR048_020365 [Dryococelus australis]
MEFIQKPLQCVLTQVIDHPVLLLLDNHSSHLALEAINFCRDHSIHLLTLPPHSSHKMQPLDRNFFGPLKAFYSDECNKWLFCELYGVAHERCATLEKAPINCDVFMDEDFLPSRVTDFKQYRECCRPTEERGDDRAESSKVDKEVDSRETTCLATQDIYSSVSTVVKSNSMASPLTRETSNDFIINKPGCSGITTTVSPSQIIPFPKSKHSEIFDSPYKNRLLQDLKEKNKITAKNERSNKRLGLKKVNGNHRAKYNAQTVRRCMLTHLIRTGSNVLHVTHGGMKTVAPTRIH